MARSADALARAHTEKAISVLAEVMEDTFAENKDRIKAADSILDRGHGKPLNATISLPATRAQAAMLAAMGDEELMALVNSKPLPRLGHDAIDAEFTPVAPKRDPLLD